jgi:Uma2 family endonuclease
MTEAQVFTPPPGGWTVEDLDAMPVSNYRHELTDGALSVSPSPSNLHQTFAHHLMTVLERLAPEPLVVAYGVEIRFNRQLTRIPDLMVVHSDSPGRHWFPPAEVLLAIEVESPGSHVEDRATKPMLYAQHGIPHYWRFELEPPKVSIYGLDADRYRISGEGERLTVSEPFELDIAVRDLLPRWARD